MWALVRGAARGLSPARAGDLTAHFGRSPADLAALAEELVHEDVLVRDPRGGWTLHPEAALLPGVNPRLHTPGRAAGPESPAGIPESPAGIPSGASLDLARLGSLYRTDPAAFEAYVDAHVARLDAGRRARSGYLMPGLVQGGAGGPSSGMSGSGPGIAVAVLDRLWPVLDAVRGTGARLLRVSLTVATWGALRPALAAFGAALDARGEDRLLVVDVSSEGKLHLYGYVVSGDREGVLAAWLHCSGATVEEKGKVVRAVTGWQAYAESGDPDARAGRSRQTLRANLTRSVHYAFHAWPTPYGSRDLARDVDASGVFAPVWAEVLAAVEDPAPALTGGALRP
jgi:hypothetical protein